MDAGSHPAEVTFDRIADEYDETRGGRARAQDAARDVALNGEPEHPDDDDLERATRGLRSVGGGRHDTPSEVLAAAPATLRAVTQLPSSPQTARHTPAELADIVRRRVWSRLRDLNDATWDATWQAQAEPVLRALGALQDQDRPRPQRGHRVRAALSFTPAREPPATGERGRRRRPCEPRPA